MADRMTLREWLDEQYEGDATGWDLVSWRLDRAAKAERALRAFLDAKQTDYSESYHRFYLDAMEDALNE